MLVSLTLIEDDCPLIGFRAVDCAERMLPPFVLGS